MRKYGFTVLGLVIISIFLMVTVTFSSELDDIRSAIRAKGAQWVAGETSLSRLPLAERQMRLGLVPPLLTGTEPILTYSPYTALPSTLDWRNNGGNFVTPIRDQGGCGSCWAFATTAALESSILISNHTPGIDLNTAEQVLVSCSTAGSCNGGAPSTASDFIRDTGLPLETCYPYTATNGNCANACANWRSSTYRISGWSWVATTAPTLEAIKNALYTKGPLVTTMAVYNDFFNYKSGVYSYTTGDLAGYHGVLIVGYDDSVETDQLAENVIADNLRKGGHVGRIER